MALNKYLAHQRRSLIRPKGVASMTVFPVQWPTIAHKAAKNQNHVFVDTIVRQMWANHNLALLESLVTVLNLQHLKSVQIVPRAGMYNLRFFKTLYLGCHKNRLSHSRLGNISFIALVTISYFLSFAALTRDKIWYRLSSDKTDITSTLIW